MTPRKRLALRSCLAVASLTSTLLFFECALQVGAFVVERSAPRASIAGLGGARRVLSLGDSNTYGLYVEREQAYPQVFEKLWNADASRVPIEVVNLGFPGTNSSTVRKNFPGLIRSVRPDLVTLLIGTNDFWTLPEEPDAKDSAAGALADFAWRHSRLFRLLYIGTRTFEVPVLSGDFSLERPLPFDTRRVAVSEGGETFFLGFIRARGGGEVPQWKRRLRENLEAILAIAQERGVEIVLLSYPAEEWPYGRTNRLLREFAAQHPEVRFIDLGAELKPRCPKGVCAELLSDLHPSPAGYEFAARVLLRELH